MAMTLGDILINVKSDTSELVKGFNRAESTVKKTTENMKNAVLAVAAGFVTFQTITKSVEAYKVQEQAVAKLNATLKATGGAAGFSSKQLQDYASELQGVTTIGDEATISMMSVLNTFKLISGDTYKRAVVAIQDLSIAMGQDLQSSAVQVGKALNDPILGVSALGRVGIQFSESQKEMIKTLSETNRVSEAQAIILKELESQFGGSAKAVANTASGALTQLNNTYGDLLEEIGKVTLQIGLQSGAFSDSKKSIEDLTDSVREFSNYISSIQSEIDYTTAVISRTIDAFNLLYEVAENTAQMAVSGIASLVYGTIEPIFAILAKTAQGLNSIGLSSNENVKNALEQQIWIHERLEIANKNSVQSQKEISEAYKKFGVSISDRVLLAQKEREVSEQNLFIEKERAKLATQKKDSGGSVFGKKEDPTEEQFNADWDKSEYEDAKAAVDEYFASLEAAKKSAADKAALEADFAQIMQDNYMSMLDSQVALAESTNAWNDGLTGVAGNLASVAKAMNKFQVDQLKATKAQITLDEKYEKQKKKFAGDTEKIAKIEENYTKDTAQIKEQARQNELQGYSQLAGAMSGFFEAGSTGAKALTAVQATLGITAGIAGIMNAWASAPFPANLPAVAASTAAILPSIATLTSLGGSGGEGAGNGGGAASAPDYSSKIESASFATNTNVSLEDYDNNFDKFIEGLDTAADKLKDFGNESQALSLTVQAQLSEIEASKNIISSLREIQSSGISIDLDTIGMGGGSEIYSKTALDAGLTPDTTRDGISIYYDAMLKSKYAVDNEVKEAQSNIEKLYESLNSYFIEEVADALDMSSFSLDKLKEVTKDVTIVAEDGSIKTEAFNRAKAEEVEARINEIALLQKGGQDISAYSSELTELFTDEHYVKLKDYGEALELIDEAAQEIIDERAGLQQTLDLLRGVKTQRDIELESLDASNRMLQIQIWAEEERRKAIEEQIRVLEQSVSSIRSFTLSLLDNEEKAEYLARELGVNLAESYEELGELTRQLTMDSDSLTSADMELINANKSLIDSFSDVSKEISILEGVIGTIETTIEKLRSGAETSEDSLSKFYESIKEAQRLSAGDDYESFAASVQKAIGYTSALFETSNFQTQRDMQFAQLVAANQFGDLETTAMEQIDYLRLIEENTRSQVLALVDAMGKLGADVKASIPSAPSAPMLPKVSATEALITGAYEAMFDRAPDAGGLSYWTSQVDSGKVTVANLADALKIGAAVNPSSISKQDYATAVAKGYSQGGYTGNGGMYEPAGIVHRGEFVVNKDNTAKLGLNQNMGNVFTELLNEMKLMRKENTDMKNLLAKSNGYQQDIQRNTKTSMFVEVA